MAFRKSDDPIVQPELYDEFGDYRFKWVTADDVKLIRSEIERGHIGAYRHYLGLLRWYVKRPELGRIKVIVLFVPNDSSYNVQFSEGYPKRGMEKIAIADRANLLLRGYLKYREEQVDA